MSTAALDLPAFTAIPGVPSKRITGKLRVAYAITGERRGVAEAIAAGDLIERALDQDTAVYFAALGALQGITNAVPAPDAIPLVKPIFDA